MIVYFIDGSEKIIALGFQLQTMRQQGALFTK